MSDRITEKRLKSLVDYINELTGQPKEAYSKQEDGTYKANVGNYHIDGAYGGVNLHQICTDGGGVTEPLGGGYWTKKELYQKLHAFIRGIGVGKELKD